MMQPKLLQQKERISYWKIFLLLMLAVFLSLGITAALRFAVFQREKEKTATFKFTTPLVPKNTVKYDCVNGSRSLVDFKLALRPLVDLNIPEMQPTRVFGNLEYLLIPEPVYRKDAQKICTAWCGYLVPIKDPKQNEMILEMVRSNMPEFSFYWIGVRGWKGNWYMDDDSKVTFLNFQDHGEANQSIVNSADDTVEIDSGCVQVSSSGTWSTIYCEEMRPFICERNISSSDVERTPFYPFQEKECANVGGKCQYDTECNSNTSRIIINLCPSQALNIRCCVPNVPIPAPIYNTSVASCAEAGGVCNHVSEDECRDGRVIFDLEEPCPDRPRKLGCCVQQKALSKTSRHRAVMRINKK